MNLQKDIQEQFEAAAKWVGKFSRYEPSDLMKVFAGTKDDLIALKSEMVDERKARNFRFGAACLSGVLAIGIYYWDAEPALVAVMGMITLLQANAAIGSETALGAHHRGVRNLMATHGMKPVFAK